MSIINFYFKHFLFSSHVRIGGVALSANCTANSTENCTIASRIYQIAEVRVHPSYDQPKYANDIALVKIIGEASGEFINIIFFITLFLL